MTNLSDSFEKTTALVAAITTVKPEDMLEDSIIICRELKPLLDENKIALVLPDTWSRTDTIRMGELRSLCFSGTGSRAEIQREVEALTSADKGVLHRLLLNIARQSEKRLTERMEAVL